MRPIKESWCGQIDVTYYCGKECVYCTRYDRHLSNRRYHMEVDFFKKALESYRGFPGFIGIIGGEPLIHPKFKELCEEIQDRYPPNKVMLWTSLPYWTTKHRETIAQTFCAVHYHPHSAPEDLHQQITLAAKDVVKDENLRRDLIDDCWLQRRWCPTITADGAFFCESGAALARIMGVKGWPVEPGWWKREPKDFGDQMDICQFCGASIPMERQSKLDTKQRISPSVRKIMHEAGLPLGNYEDFDREITADEMKKALPNWTPGIYKKEQCDEQFAWSTIDWSKYK